MGTDSIFLFNVSCYCNTIEASGGNYLKWSIKNLEQLYAITYPLPTPFCSGKFRNWKLKADWLSGTDYPECVCSAFSKYPSLCFPHKKFPLNETFVSKETWKLPMMRQSLVTWILTAVGLSIVWLHMVLHFLNVQGGLAIDKQHLFDIKHPFDIKWIKVSNMKAITEYVRSSFDSRVSI